MQKLNSALIDNLSGHFARIGETMRVLDPTARAFGADPTGTDDSSSAIQKALDVAPRRKGIFIPSGVYVIDSTVTIYNQALIFGKRASGNDHGAEFRAGPNLGTDPMFSGTEQLSRGGFHNILFRGTSDVSGGDCIDLAAAGPVTDFWRMDYVFIRDFTGSAIKIVPSGSSWAGNPLEFGHVKINGCGLDGTSPAFYVEQNNGGVFYIRYLAGDNNGHSLLGIKDMNTFGCVQIDHIQSERSIDGRQNNIIYADNIANGTVMVNRFWIYSNVSGGTNGNAWIKEVNSTTLKAIIGYAHNQDVGSNNYSYAFDDGTLQIPVTQARKSAPFLVRIPKGRAPVQLTDTATISVNAGLGEVFEVTLGGNRAMGLPTGSKIGQRITFIVKQDGTGGRTLGWHANYSQAWSDTGNAAGKRSTISFIYNGANWMQDGAQSPYI